MRTLLILTIMLAIGTVLTGCGGTRSTTTVTLDDEQPSVQHDLPDTLTTAPTPLPLATTPTQPLKVQRFSRPDTTSPRRLFTALEFDRRSDRVEVRLDDRTFTFRAPARGEALAIRPDSSGSLQAGISGTPTPRTVRVDSERGAALGWGVLKWAAGVVILTLLLTFLNCVVR